MRSDCGSYFWRGVVSVLTRCIFSSASECLGIHAGGPQAANLGDGNDWVNQTLELRQDYGNTGLGTCLESLAGGKHLRLFRQNGPTANTGALFLAYVF